MNTICAAPVNTPCFGIAGHAGIAHAYSHSGFVQEDSGGFALLLALLDQACKLDVSIASVTVAEGSRVQVTTGGGGCGEAFARRGITPLEEQLMRNVLGMQSFAPQTVATRAFGRIYGQGAMEPAAAFCLAVAKAMADTVRKTWPHKTFSAPENLPGACGEFIGGGLSLHGSQANWLLSINASEGGIGPIEDAEGCVPVGNKGLLMQSLGLCDVPIIMLEGKSYVPQLKDQIQETTFLVRWNEEYDNPVVGECCARALESSGWPYLIINNAYPRMDGALEKSTRAAGESLIKLGSAYANATTAAQKIEIAAEVCRFASEDLGGSIFMSNAVHQYAGSGGMWPGFGAMLSWTMDKKAIDHWRIPIIEDQDIDRGLSVLVEVARLLLARCEEATRILQQRKPALSQAQINALASVAE